MENHIEEETKQDKGFTLVELLIVIVILGILATVTVFAVTGITNKGKTSACQSDAKTIQTAEEAYSANTGSYTASSVGSRQRRPHARSSTKFTIALVAATRRGPGHRSQLHSSPVVAGGGLRRHDLLIF